MLRRVASPYRFLVDECLGFSIVPDAVRAALQPSEEVLIFTDAFERGAKDEVWLRKVGPLGLVVLTKDGRLRFRPNERRALVEAKAAIFMVSSGPGVAMAEKIVTALPTVRRVLRGQEPSIVGRILDGGAIALSIVAGETVQKHVKKPIGG